MANKKPSFIANVNTLASKVDTIIEANKIFDAGIIPVLDEISQLNLEEVTADLLKGAYLGNRKIDIDLALNVKGITSKLTRLDLPAALLYGMIQIEKV